MPGASASGRLAASPMATVITAATSAVEVSSAPACPSPAAAPRICGFTNRMYAIVTNVVAPARTSRRTVVPREPSPKNVSSGEDAFGAAVMRCIIQALRIRLAHRDTDLVFPRAGNLRLGRTLGDFHAEARRPADSRIPSPVPPGTCHYEDGQS